jgi:hypothetical protein
MLLLLAALLVGTPAKGQTIRETAGKLKSSWLTRSDITALKEHLTGTWTLQQTIRHEDGDSIMQAASVAMWLTPGAKPFTTIDMDAAGNFVIDQACMKCPMLRWQGRYELKIRTINGACFFHLRFPVYVPTATNEMVSIVDEFDGLLTDFHNGAMILTDKYGREWIYRLYRAESGLRK